MSALGFNRYILQCDGCKARHGDPHGHNSAQEARIAAYIDGWRYPSMLRRTAPSAVGRLTCVRSACRRGRRSGGGSGISPVS